MRSMKLLAATAVLAALVAGPVLAQDAGGTMTPDSTTKSAPAKATKKHKKPVRHKKASSSTTTPSTTEGTTK